MPIFPMYTLYAKSDEYLNGKNDNTFCNHTGIIGIGITDPARSEQTAIDIAHGWL